MNRERNPRKEDEGDDVAAVLPQKLSLLLELSGACAFGTAPAAEVPEEEWRLFEAWLEAGMHAGMTYMERHKELRRDPRLLLEGAKTVISTAFNYRQPNPYPAIATYALGEDYHIVIRKRLKSVVRCLKEEFGGEYRICVDSAPITERYWAQKCGVGSRSPVSGTIMVPTVGSMVFLAEILTTLDIPHFNSTPYNKYESESAVSEKNGSAGVSPKCPAGALLHGGTVDARRCVNYLTIEHQGEFTPEQLKLLDTPGVKGKVFGCDVCQLACPSNSSAPIPVISEFQPLTELPDYIEVLKSGSPAPPGMKKSPLYRKIRSGAK